ncbi:exosporium protein E [Fredinandcohnia quinoae]|uniref:Exosporium protein E n=1 Tax=Fredinandcohnia quinoae TaxID=2918902 RepID=A0AAW5E4X7_9BACI|nr:exosporium protein E [Fredinandcohnia sp. SECRCQ15]MCH1624655.1 exosporium protein E [Fredinandcohnia sp. SECRCQ15]
MRKWRVGTISMGLSLVLLGVLLFISQVSDIKMVEPLLVWWPLILVVLGIEILVYLFLSKQENPVVKYDFLSILFVGIIGTIGIGFTILSSTGLLTEAQKFVGAEHTTLNLPEVKEELSTTVKRIVVDTNNTVNIEGSNANELHVFGTYRATINKDVHAPIQDKDDYVLTKIVGDTMYVTLKEPANYEGPFSTYTAMEPTIIVPNSISLEVRGDHNNLELYPGSLENNWNVNGASYVTVHVNKTNDVLLTATSNNDLKDGHVKWDSIETTDRGGIDETYEEESSEKLYKGILKLGNGTHRLNIFNSELVSVNLVEGK